MKPLSNRLGAFLFGGDLSTPFSFRFSHNVDLLVERAAEAEGISYSEWMRRAYWAYTKEAHNG